MKINKLIIVLAFFVICFALYLVPSANITEEASERYLNIDDPFFSENILINNTHAEGTFGTSATVPIPIEDKTGREASSSNFGENTYEDETIKVKIENGRYEDSDYHVAYIEIADPSQIRTAVASKVVGTQTIQMSDIAPRTNAVVAVNGDFFTHNKIGYIIRQGETLRKKTTNQLDMLFIDSLGDFHIITSEGKEQANEIKSLLEQYDIINSFVFGPALVIDGQVQAMPDHYQFAIKYKNPRAAIAQIDKLKYAIVIVDGRSENNSGVTCESLAEICKNIGAKQAFNLDGGNSAVMYFKDSLYTHKSKENERFISDIIYFTSARME